MDSPQDEFYTEPRTEALAVLFRIIGRRPWDELQSWHKVLPGSRIEHIGRGIYVLIIEPGASTSIAHSERRPPMR